MRAADHEQNTFRFADRRNNAMNIPVSLLHHSGDLPKMEQNHPSSLMLVVLPV
jgi:hypothetical protein